MAGKPERNDPCHCGSGKKYKHCCQDKDKSQFSSKLGMAGLLVAIVLGLIFVGFALSGGEGPNNCPPGTVWSDAHQHCH
jgi:hypothetical protein